MSKGLTELVRSECFPIGAMIVVSERGACQRATGRDGSELYAVVGPFVKAGAGYTSSDRLRQCVVPELAGRNDSVLICDAPHFAQFVV